MTPDLPVDEVHRWHFELIHDALADDPNTPEIARRRNRRRRARAVFLAAYVTTFDASEAARLAGVSRHAAKGWRRHDPTFRAAQATARWAIGNGCSKRSTAGRWRARRSPSTRAQLVDTTIDYSDQLLVKLAKRIDPNRWGEHATMAIANRTDASAQLLRRILSDPDAFTAAHRLDVLDNNGTSPLGRASTSSAEPAPSITWCRRSRASSWPRTTPRRRPRRSRCR